ncbi:MAG TPA: hypothetical protein VGW78_07685 [Candidatus Babeliales bacterium]|jgi:hypothetical protein|nr:hypothetical protein [Candidatus Babeliales bacterium]
MTESEIKHQFFKSMKEYFLTMITNNEFYQYSCIIQNTSKGEFIIANQCLTLGIPKIFDKYQKLLEFINSIINTDKFSSANHWYLHLEAKKVLEELGEIK